jgi:uncharacterized repeat protein (TIGR03803 family)
LVRDKEGNLYGITGEGGSDGQGAAFRVSKAGHETLLHSFSASDGVIPMAGLVQDAKGNLYGTCSGGGGSYGSGYGTVFELTP